MKTYVTFGQDHIHKIGGLVFDKDCVAVVEGDRAKVFEIFGPKFCFEYSNIGAIDMSYFSRGLVEVPKVSHDGDSDYWKSTEECRQCSSFALNIDPKRVLCDVCFYKHPLLGLLAVIHRDGGHYTTEYGIVESVEAAEELIQDMRKDIESLGMGEK